MTAPTTGAAEQLAELRRRIAKAVHESGPGCVDNRQVGRIVDAVVAALAAPPARGALQPAELPGLMDDPDAKAVFDLLAPATPPAPAEACKPICSRCIPGERCDPACSVCRPDGSGA